MDDSGYTAIRHYSSSPRQVVIGSDTYCFVPRHNISLAWVKNEHVDQVLAIKKVCCGGSKKPRFLLADDVHINRWRNGGR